MVLSLPAAYLRVGVASWSWKELQSESESVLAIAKSGGGHGFVVGLGFCLLRESKLTKWRRRSHSFYANALSPIALSSQGCIVKLILIFATTFFFF